MPNRLVDGISVLAPETQVSMKRGSTRSIFRPVSPLVIEADIQNPPLSRAIGGPGLELNQACPVLHHHKI